MRAALLLLILLALLLSPAPAVSPLSAEPGASPVPVAADESSSGALVATLRSLDTASGTLSLLTGRGHALRVVQVALPRGTEIKRMGAAIPLSELKPGAIVRVRFAPEPIRGVRQASAVEVQEGGR